MPQKARGLARRPYNGKRAVGNIHSVYDRLILLCKSERKETPTTTAAAADTDKAESPRNRPVRPGGLPAARATGGDAGGRPSGWRAPPAAAPNEATSCSACTSRHDATVRWDGSCRACSACRVDGAPPTIGSEKSRRFPPVLVYARRLPEVKKRFKKRAGKNDAPRPCGNSSRRSKRPSATGRVQWSLRRLAQVRRLVELVVERFEADAEFRGGLGLVARVTIERLVNRLHLQIAEVQRREGT